MPVNQTSYQNGKIYKIWSLQTDKIYIGSTCDTLTNRMCKHRLDYKNWKEGKRNLVTSAVLFDLVGLENCKLGLIHNFPCESKNELQAEEGRVMRANKDLIVNRCIAGRGKEEYRDEHKEEMKEYKKEYSLKHKEEIKEYKKEYYQQNKEERTIKNKEYRDTHKEQIKEYIKEYQKEHKEEIKIKRNQKITCECGSPYTLHHKSRHFKTKKHQDFIKPQ